MKKIGFLFSIFSFFISTLAFSASYPIPKATEALIGEVQYRSAASGDNVITIAKQYDIGYNAIENANPTLNTNRGFSQGVLLQLPTQHLLPNQPREGIVINLPEMRMYYYVEGSGQVLTYPIGIGKIGKTIPITKTSIVRKTENPTWIPPEDIRAFNLKQGIVLPRVMPPGPDNPLGPYAIYMRIPTYLIHSTIFPESVGKRASFGCIRMFESDIEDFFPSVHKGIPVVITNAPAKVGWQEDRLYLEAHHPLEEHSSIYEASLPGMVSLVMSATKDRLVLVDWQAVTYLAKERDGIPHEVGISLS